MLTSWIYLNCIKCPVPDDLSRLVNTSRNGASFLPLPYPITSPNVVIGLSAGQTTENESSAKALASISLSAGMMGDGFLRENQ